VSTSASDFGVAVSPNWVAESVIRYLGDSVLLGPLLAPPA
jgi:hypothetical protein